MIPVDQAVFYVFLWDGSRSIFATRTLCPNPLAILEGEHPWNSSGMGWKENMAGKSLSNSAMIVLVT
jgi:hypothetical protein